MPILLMLVAYLLQYILYILSFFEHLQVFFQKLFSGKYTLILCKKIYQILPLLISKIKSIFNFIYSHSVCEVPALRIYP